jgi:hypothetical protein
MSHYETRIGKLLEIMVIKISDLDYSDGKKELKS